MADRSVSIALEAKVSGFVTGIRTAQRAVSGFSADLDKSAKKRQALSSLGDTAGKVGLAAAAGLGAAVVASANFDEAMSNVEAATHASAGSMEAMRAAALKAGAQTAFSATEAAAGIENLAKAGVSTQDILSGGLDGALSLAAAGELEVADAAEYAATAMAQFGLAGGEVEHVADLLAAAAGKAQGDVSDFGAALAQGGLVADQTGLSIEETTTALAMFAEQGLLGSDAGTSMKTMLQSLTPTSEKAASAMEQYGLSAYDAQGSFIGLEEWAGRLREGLAGMSDEQRNATMKTIFGADAVRAASIIYEGGAEGVAEWSKKVDDSGYAAHTAALKMDNLKGDLEELSGALETALIGAGDGSQGVLRSATQGLTGLIRKFNELPPASQNVATGLLGITAVTGGGLWFGAKVINGISDTRQALSDLGWTADKTKGAMSGMAKAGAVVAVAELASMVGEIGDVDYELGELQRRLVLMGEQGEAADLLDGIARGVGSLGEGLKQAAWGDLEQIATFMGADYGITDEIKDLDAALADMDPEQAKATFGVLLKEGKAAGLSVKDVTDLFPKYRTELDLAAEEAKAAAAATADHTDAAKGNARAVDQETESLESAETALIEYTDAQNRAADAATENKRTALALEQAMQDGREEARKGTKTLNENTEAGRDNWSALLDVAEQWNDTERRVQEARGAYKQMRREFIDLAVDMGASRKEAEKYADKFLDIPPNVAKAKGAVDQFARDTAGALRGIDNEVVEITLSARANKVAAQLDRFGGSGLAAGGPVSGPGTGTSDSIPVRLSNGEHVLTAREVQAFGGHQKVKLWRNAALRRRLPDPNDLPGFAEGGPVLATVVRQSGLSSSINAIERWTSQIDAALEERMSKAMSKAMTRMPVGGNPLGFRGSLSPAQIAAGQQFASSQRGKPYIWGGVGPGGYDCSGFQSAVLNAAWGRNPYQRLGATGTMPWPGSSPGVGRYTIGWFTGSPGHTSGNIGGLGVESRGGDGVVVGGGARSPMSFPRRMHYDRGGKLLPGTTVVVNDTGKPETVRTDDQEKGLERELRQLRRSVEKRSERLQAELDKQTGELKGLRSDEKAYRQTVAGNFRVDPFANNATLGGVMRSLENDTQNASKFLRYGRQARRMGLSGGVFKELLASGNTAVLGDIDSTRDVRRLEAAWAARSAATRQLGQFSGDTFYARSQRETSRVTTDLRDTIKRLNRRIDHLDERLEKAVERGAEKGTEKGADRDRRRRKTASVRGRL